MLFLILFIQILRVSAQDSEESDTLYINYLGQEKGLLQLNSKAIVIDSLGFLWVGTEDGLHKFDGYEFSPHVHDPNDANSIKDDHIRGLLALKDTIFIASNSEGILGYQLSKEKYFSIPISKDLLDEKIAYDAFLLNKNTVLFSLKNNFVVYNLVSKKAQAFSLPKRKKENFIQAAVSLNQEKFLLATSESGILQFNLQEKKLEPFALFQDINIKSLQHIENRLFVGTKEGFSIFSSENTMEKNVATPEVKCFYQFSENQVFIGTEMGLYSYDLIQNKLKKLILKTNNKNIYGNVGINTIVGDEKGNLWIGTEGEGVIYHNQYQKKFNTLKIRLKEYPNHENISPFQFLAQNDDLWIGTELGIVKYTEATQEFKLYKQAEKDLIYAIRKDNQDRIWAGGFDAGLLKYNPKTDSFQHYVHDKNDEFSISNNDVIEILPVDNQTLWVCTWTGGINEFNTETEEFKPLLINGQALNRARIAFQDSQGFYWLGTDEGLFKLKGKKLVTIFSKEQEGDKRLINDRVFAITEDNNQNIWVGTAAGISKIENGEKSMAHYGKQKGLPNDFIYSLMVDGENQLWMGTNYGVSVFNPQSKSFRNFTEKDGLQNNEFNGKAGYKDENGNFYLGGMRGINIFNPKDIKENPYLPNVYIHQIDLFNEPITSNELYEDHLYFKSEENVLTLNYTSLNFLNPEKISYKYILESFDEDWRSVTQEKSTTYTNLPPGEYLFRVTSTNDVGKWSESYDELKITIVPPWYQTTWFKILGIAMIILLFLLFYYSKTRKLKKDKLVLEDRVKQRTLSLKKSNEKLKTSHKNLEEKNDNIQFLMKELDHRVKNNLQIVSSFLNIQANSVASDKAKQILLVAKNRISSISIIHDLLSKEQEEFIVPDFIKNFTEKILVLLGNESERKFTVVYNLQENTPAVKANSVLIGLMLNELITNVHKYAFPIYDPKNNLIIGCQLKDASIHLQIRDNGKGFSAEDNSSSSLGLEIVREMVEQLNGNITIKSSNGVEILITIPYH
ncbi:two-component regulator propeller domain-containing protein [Mesonia ostreae]|uniref:Two-component regulator propeller domain-containing protein n=1 Tax=Mesonia ostreae TaxID=861110 RepID=A0ABU2KL28_9FLAO|nr:two-component regulator propeller domain-containing protein [Mesonia ostreae]MDT0295408.1 two-component regulator propeller domain-containing protein [Mesonia ostreae]